MFNDLPASRKKAKASGSKYYFTGKKCLRGHIERRNTKSGKCFGCDRFHSANFRAKNPDYSPAWNKKYYQENKSQIAAGVKKYYEKNKQKLNEGKKARYIEGREIYNANSREDYVANKERYALLSREYHVKNAGRIKEKNKEWRLNNKDKIRNNNFLQKRKRRALTDAPSDVFLLDVLNKQSAKCAYCQCDIKEQWEIDHKLPVSRGGDNGPHNIHLVCRPCNCRKGTKTHDEFLKRLLLEKMATPPRIKSRRRSATGTKPLNRSTKK